MRNGGQTTEYNMGLSFFEADLLNIVGLNITFPDEYSILPQTITCEAVRGFSITGALPCGVSQNNLLYVSSSSIIRTGGTAMVKLVGVLNPIVDSGIFTFTFSKGNSANSSLSRFTQSFAFSFVPPSIQVQTMTFDPSIVFTSGSKATMVFFPLYTIKRGSFLTIKLPVAGMIDTIGRTVDCSSPNTPNIGSNL